LGLCTTLAVSIRVENAIAMSLATIFVLTASNFVISILAWQIPKKVRIPAYLVIIATFVTLVEMTLESFYPAMHRALGIYLPLITVNCIVLARVEAFASKHEALASAADGFGMGIGYAWGIMIISIIRELFGTGKIVLGNFYLGIGIPPMELLVLPPGGFLVIGLILGVLTYRRKHTNG
ncbi:MAG: electron transport complex subunit RsxE, partial [Candidatus Hydrothermarchaeales archaeon]